MSGNELRVAVVTGGHSYDVPRFCELFRSMDGLDVYIQHLDDFASSPVEVRESYDVVLFYIMMKEGPPTEGLPWYAGQPKDALLGVGASGKGVVILHHALLAYPSWPFWDELVGVHGRGFGYHIGEPLQVHVEDASHPITEGLSDWDMVDETYTMPDAGKGSDVLLTTNHPNSMHTLAWTRTYRKTRVFNYQSGHDRESWSNPGFRTVLQRGILWSAGRL